MALPEITIVLLMALSPIAFRQSDGNTRILRANCKNDKVRIAIGFSGVRSRILLTDPAGHRFGIDREGKNVPREIPGSYYEDDDTAEMDTGLLDKEKPREMVIPVASTGDYRIEITPRRKEDQWFKLTTVSCGKIWRQEFSLTSKEASSAVRLVVGPSGASDGEPQLFINDTLIYPIHKSSVAKPH